MSQRVALTVHDDGSVRVRVNLPLDVEHTRLFDQRWPTTTSHAFDAESNFQQASRWAQHLLDFSTGPRG